MNQNSARQKTLASVIANEARQRAANIAGVRGQFVRNLSDSAEALLFACTDQSKQGADSAAYALQTSV